MANCAWGTAVNVQQSREHRTVPRLGWPLAIATGIALLFLAFAAWLTWLNMTQATGVDFISFWAAGRLAGEGNAAAAYDIAAHHAVELTAIPIHGLMPFPYPPPFLFFVTPFGMLPYHGAAVAWLLVTAPLYVYASTRFTRWQVAIANPALILDSAILQSGFLTCGIFVAGLFLIDSAPLAAGAILGCLVVKPQLALLLPFATIAGRKWRVIAGAIASSVVLVVAAVVVFGADTYTGFWNILPYYVAQLHGSKWPWNELASPFALARFVGVSETPALVIHTVVALAATAATVRAWWLDLDTKIPVLAAATLLIPPYIFTYDCLLMILPAAWLFRERRYAMVAVVWLCCFVPLLTYATPLVWPNLIPIAAALCLWLLRGSQARGSYAAKAVSA